jgi:CRISPR/Cas system-associated exonuclease Cas4 (RecB family)
MTCATIWRTTVAKTKIETPPEEFHLSATRIVDWLTCPSLYQRKYILKQPIQKKSSAAFGNALHDTIEKWHELGGVEAGPIEKVFYGVYAETFPDVWEKVRRMVIQAQVLDDLEAGIRKRRPEIKNPRQTKEWLESSDWKEFVAMNEATAEMAEHSELFTYSKTEPPYKLWVLGLELLAKYIDAFKGQPEPVAVETSFEGKVGEDLYIRGRIDMVRPLVVPDTGEVATATIDLKSGVKAMTPQSAFVQGTIYGYATRCGWLPAEFESDLVLFYMLRDATIQPFLYNDQCWKQLLKVIEEVKHGISRKKYPRSFSMMGCGMCDFKDDCAAELGVFPSGPIPAQEYFVRRVEEPQSAGGE